MTYIDIIECISALHVAQLIFGIWISLDIPFLKWNLSYN